jgi:hypothetical protein
MTNEKPTLTELLKKKFPYITPLQLKGTLEAVDEWLESRGAC